MADYESEVRISKSAFEVSAIFLYVLATLAASTRVIIRIRLQKLAWLDDGFLLFAFIIMTACLAMLFQFIDDLYTSWGYANGFIRTQISLPAITALAINLHNWTTAFIVPAWTGICAVKFCFLFFFRGLIRRIRHLEIFWWVTVAFTAVSWVAGAIAEAFACPRYDQRVCMTSRAA